MTYVILGLIVAVLGVYLWKKRPVKDIDIPEYPRREGIFYGYYGCIGDQAAVVKDHTNVLWEGQMEGIDKAILNMKVAQKPVILDVSQQVFDINRPSGRNHDFDPHAIRNLRELFDRLRQEDVLRYIVALVPQDEPNTNVRSEQDLQMAIDAIKFVKQYYPELNETKLAIIYAAKPYPYMLKNQFDWIGVDDYDLKSQIFVNGTYAQLKEGLLPHQKTILLPGGAFGQDPKPFVNFAYANPEVGLIIPFVWFGPLQANDKWTGIKDEPSQRILYEAAGRSVTGQ